ncbi:unnamed protein product [Mycena citricolor]|uniref:Uncharacterized protein n=1 Tax=Mycena citricolor TaxID=2018698 RepID=A0AAD2HS23_9AGAR|nr:unnamed protein product [Mycena citricolor]
MRSLNDSSPQSPHPILQYVVLLDLKNLSTQSLVRETGKSAVPLKPKIDRRPPEHRSGHLGASRGQPTLSGSARGG